MTTALCTGCISDSMAPKWLSHVGERATTTGGGKQPLDRICRSPDRSFMQELPLLVPRAPEISLGISPDWRHS
ncbi:hypothetical protein BO70DRAFT_364643 [Aspergillus heteromorphus CBS 117.55]|uniref:Uncharacterized protein n=1 Tax=Aspergillus heteromorphus CBS 117.55 TaxID=1448321 RepID=A0A317VKN5_9EURO|nr:uncharacterized protein BO70DRAFT_364643 [Aspergillus heteromorphus CBS 117.55]PWY73727.1 hypothetical protein BO70DRAFT_364643 [Aspergillus heteromorphus CBS 117.55]